MKLLEKEFVGRGEVSGVQFTQLDRNGDICIYKRVDPDGFTAYEVIKVQKSKEMTANFGGISVHYEAKERYPKAEKWGSTKRTTTDIEKAYKYFNDFAKEINQAN